MQRLQRLRQTPSKTCRCEQPAACHSAPRSAPGCPANHGSTLAAHDAAGALPRLLLKPAFQYPPPCPPQLMPGVLELSQFLDELGVPRALVTRNVNCELGLGEGGSSRQGVACLIHSA